MSRAEKFEIKVGGYYKVIKDITLPLGNREPKRRLYKDEIYRCTEISHIAGYQAYLYEVDGKSAVCITEDMEYWEFLEPVEVTETEIIPIESEQPHRVSEVICIKCQHRWIAVRPATTKLKELRCPHCNKVGAVIETGEMIFEEGD